MSMPTVEIQWTGHKFYHRESDQWFKIIARDAYDKDTTKEICIYVSELTGRIYSGPWDKLEDLEFFSSSTLAEKAEKDEKDL